MAPRGDRGTDEHPAGGRGRRAALADRADARACLRRRSRALPARRRAPRVARRRAGGPALGLAGAGARRHPGHQRAPPHLVVRPPDPRPVGRRLALPRGDPDFNKTFDVALHLGTLVAVVAYFWTDVVRYVKAFVVFAKRRSIRTDDERLAVGIAIATIPAAIAGALGESAIEDHLGQPWQIAIFLSVFAILLWIADRRPQRIEIDALSMKAAFLIGVSQILALMPGVSRSGITITTSRFSELTRDAAA